MTTPWAQFLILDDSSNDAQSIKSYLEELFRGINLTIDATAISDPREVPKYIDAHPDFFIVDVRWSEKEKTAGLELIQNLKPRYPHVNFIAATMESQELPKVGELVVQPDFVLAKLKIMSAESKAFNVFLLGYFIANRRQNRMLRVSRETKVDELFKRSFALACFDPALFDCLVRQVFKPFDFQLDAAQFWKEPSKRVSSRSAEARMSLDDLDLSEVVDFVKIRALDEQWSRSGSAVYIAEPRYRNRSYQVSLILKFCPMRDFLKEISNFARYVKWMLPYSWRVDVLGEGISSTIGLIAYSLAFAGSAASHPLAKYAAENKSAPVARFIEQAFSPDNSTWYGRTNEAEGRYLSQDLYERYFQGQEKFLVRVAGLKDKLTTCDVFFRIYEGKKADALDEFLRRVKQLTVRAPNLRDYQTCICHGDLHFGNIMVGERAEDDARKENKSWEFAFIDFQDTGPAHIGTDFVVFENAIRKDSTFEVGTSEVEYYSLEKVFLRDFLLGVSTNVLEKDEPTYVELVAKVREAYVRNFADANRYHFVFHLFVFTLVMIDDKFELLPRRDVMLAFFCAVVDVLWEFRGGKNDATAGS